MTTRAKGLVGVVRYVVPAAISLLAYAPVAHADDAGDTATARTLGVEGITAADAGRCAEAVPKLERAEKLHHAPTTAAWLGECEIDLGRLVVGTERLQRVVHEPLPAGGSPAFAAAVARAQKALEKALPRIPSLRITVSAPPGTKLAVTIDGEAVPDAVVDTDRPVDPGPHTVQVTARGFFASGTSVALGEGQSRKVALELRPDPNARGRREERRRGAQRSTDGAPSRAPAFVAFGVGALGLGVGIAAGAAAASKSSALGGACDVNKVCPATSQSDISEGKRWSTVSTVAFIGAGAGAATGVVLWLLSGSGREERFTGFRARPVVGAGYAGIEGKF